MSGGERWRITVLAAVFAAGYLLVGLFRHWHFSSNAFDLGIFDQLVWHLSRLETPASSIRGVPHMLADHFHPILVLFAPLYWIAPAPETLIAAQAVLLGASLIPIYAFARNRLPAGDSMLIAAAYGAFWGMQRAAWFDVHELAFAPLVIAGTLLAIDRRHRGAVVALCVVVLLIKEDLAPFVTGVGVWLAWHGDRRFGIPLAILGVAALLLTTLVVIPGFAGGVVGSYHYAGAFESLRVAPWRAPLLLISPPDKLYTLVLWLSPFLFLPLASAWALLAIPIAVTRLLSDMPNHWSVGGHYSAPMAPVLAAGAADGLARLRGRYAWISGRVVRATLVLMAAVSIVVPGHQPLLRALNPKHYRPPAWLPSAQAALALVPASASVVAQSPIVPHLSHRDRIYMLDTSFPDVDVVIAAAPLGFWPLGSTDEVTRQLDGWRARGYRTVFERDGWVVLLR